MKRRDEYEKSKKNRRIALLKLIPVAACLAAVICISPFIGVRESDGGAVSTASIPDAINSAEDDISFEDSLHDASTDTPSRPLTDESTDTGDESITEDHPSRPTEGVSGTDESGADIIVPDDSLLFNGILKIYSSELCYPEDCMKEYWSYSRLCEYFGEDIGIVCPDGFTLKKSSSGESYGIDVMTCDGQPVTGGIVYYYYYGSEEHDTGDGMVIRTLLDRANACPGEGKYTTGNEIIELQNSNPSKVNGMDVVLAEAGGSYYAFFESNDTVTVLHGVGIEKERFIDFVKAAIR